MNAATFDRLTWDDVLADPLLRDLPYKVELNAEGQITSSPAKVRHAIRAAQLMNELRQRYPDSGLVMGPVAVRCKGSVRVMETDAAWGSDQWADSNRDSSAADTAPEICCEVVSMSHTAAELKEKVRLYLEAGAHEVWIQHPDRREIHRR